MPKDTPFLSPELLLHGYSVGIFPMAESRDDPEVFWVDPKKRGILPLDGFHVSRSLAREMQRTHWHFTKNAAFGAVLAGCADRSETWINEDIAQTYSALFNRGRAHSFEVWDIEKLVGGVYGVSLGTAFFGESMFSRQSNASKMALAGCVDLLGRAGFTLFDTQFITPHLASLGGIEIPRARYHLLLEKALEKTASFQRFDASSPKDVCHRLTR
ncbi:MAG: leucyl/phenylalanyl-tRNA--protein transferase [Paracoccaceae bacterium]